MSKAAQRRHAAIASDPAKEFVRVLQGFGHSHRPFTVFSDAIEMMALAMSNAVDLQQRDAREARYLQIVKAYSRAELDQISQLLALLTLAMERESISGGPSDVLGGIFGLMEFGNDRAGQFFTPFEVSTLMARMIMGDARLTIEQEGFIRMEEPACGAGGMVLAAAGALLEQGINYQRAMHASAVDVDPLCVHMTYVQLALAHIPAVVIHGNSLTLDIWSHWYTPAHVLGGWSSKLARSHDTERTYPVPMMPTAPAFPPTGAAPVMVVPAETQQEPMAETLPAGDPVEAAKPASIFEKAEQLGLF